MSLTFITRRQIRGELPSRSTPLRLLDARPLPSWSSYFSRRKNQDFTASAASAMDFTEGFHPSSEIEKLWGPGRLAETINEQISHVGFCRKAEQLQKLGASEMVRVKSIIDKEVGNFERTLKREFQPYWKPRQPVRLDSQLLNSVTTSISHFYRAIGLADWKNND